MAILAARAGKATEGAVAWSRGRSPQPRRSPALALSVLTAVDADGKRSRSEGIAALNAATDEAGASPDANRGGTTASRTIRDVS